VNPATVISDDANVVPKQSDIGPRTERKADFILDRCFVH
jgi:hypothetical protein